MGMLLKRLNYFTSLHTMKLKIVFLSLLVFASPGYPMDAKNLFKFILSEGVDVNEKSATGRTALMAACFNGNLRVV